MFTENSDFVFKKLFFTKKIPFILSISIFFLLCRMFFFNVQIDFYHVNCDLIQGFTALKKAVTTHAKKYDNFSRVVDVANQLLTHHSPYAPLTQADE